MNKPTSQTYRTTHCSAYNQALIHWGHISIWSDPASEWYIQAKGKPGWNQTYSNTAIQCCLMIKPLFRLFLHMLIGFIQRLIQLCGLNWTALNISDSYSTLGRWQKYIDSVISDKKNHDGLPCALHCSSFTQLGWIFRWVKGSVRASSLTIVDYGINYIWV